MSDSSMTVKACVLGAGAWGTTFAMILADAGCDVTLWAREPEVAAAVNDTHRNERYLPGIDLPDAVVSTADAQAALAGAKLVIAAIPSQVSRTALAAVKDFLDPQAVVVALMKGVELGTDKLMSDVVAEALDLPPDRIVVISGPNLAREIAARQPSATVVAS
ncbi:MAG: NAD(P)-binding domain-containing protein, partial [Cellulomonadaceae bacterium]|nr:NAD(P)-binding domain-containing protein [Cellulomonadaceae bacterium]